MQFSGLFSASFTRSNERQAGNDHHVVIAAACQQLSAGQLTVVITCGKEVGKTCECDVKFNVDIWKVAVMMFADERRHSLFDRPPKAARLRVGARLVAIVSDRFSTGR